MSEMSMVSIIMNCYNGEKYVREALDSVFAQTYPYFEVIFWDNCSVDQSAAIARSYDDRVKYYYSGTNTSLGEARKIALEKATGKYIAFLDIDDIYLPNKLEKQVNVMERTGAVMSYGSTIHIDANGRKIRNKRVKNHSGRILENLLHYYEINMQSVMIRKDILDDPRFNFNARYQYCPDYNLFMKIAALYDVEVIADYLVKYRITGNSLSSKTLHLVSKEVGETIHELHDIYPEISQYNVQLKQVYAKLHFYDFVAELSNDDRVEARKNIRKVFMVKPVYLVLLLLTYLPIRNKTLLKLVGR
jgi:glycosyltransferase involved in cell wall biosynthesis